MSAPVATSIHSILTNSARGPKSSMPSGMIDVEIIVRMLNTLPR